MYMIVEMLLVHFIAVVEVPVNMHWRLRSQAGAFGKGDLMSVILAMFASGTLVFFVMIHALRRRQCNHHVG